METNNEELREFVEDLKIHNDRVYESDFQKQLSASRLLKEIDE